MTFHCFPFQLENASSSWFDRFDQSAGVIFSLWRSSEQMGCIHRKTTLSFRHSLRLDNVITHSILQPPLFLWLSYRRVSYKPCLVPMITRRQRRKSNDSLVTQPRYIAAEWAPTLSIAFFFYFWRRTHLTKRKRFCRRFDSWFSCLLARCRSDESIRSLPIPKQIGTIVSLALVSLCYYFCFAPTVGERRNRVGSAETEQKKKLEGTKTKKLCCWLIEDGIE